MVLLNDYIDICHDEYLGHYYGQDDVGELNTLPTITVHHPDCESFMRHAEKHLPHYPLDANRWMDLFQTDGERAKYWPIATLKEKFYLLAH